jgi:preprotein translocase subunit SecB
MAEQKETVQPNTKVLAQFIRDMSFENILAQKGLDTNTPPDIKVQVNLDAKKRAVENQYEVIIKLSVVSSAKKGSSENSTDNGNSKLFVAENENSKLFILEIEYGGIFEITGVPEEQVHPYLMIECPRILFPYLRRIVGDITRDGGFPPLNLEQINFLALYQNEIARRQAEAEKATKN